MPQLLITDTHLTDIADAIRSKLGVETTYRPGEMAAAIAQITGAPILQAKTVTQNGTVTPDTGYDGLSSVTVDVPTSGTAPLTPDATDVTGGYVSSGTWYIGSDPAYADVYPVQQGHTYLVRLGATVGNRFRVMFSTTSPNGATAQISGTRVGDDRSNPSAYDYKPLYAPTADGYITIGKTAAGETGIPTYVYDLTAFMS